MNPVPIAPVACTESASPVILCRPHSGTYIPEEISKRLNERGRALADTDWHVGRLYAGLLPEASVIAAQFHRYVIDANRPPSGASLYPGQNTTGLCPLTDFDGEPIYEEGEEPGEDEIETRRKAFHEPYHAAIEAAIARAKARHGVAIVYDCHSIRSQIPYLFEGELPVFNVGTNDGTTCDGRIEEAAAKICEETGGDYAFVVNGRFKGGWTTRHYGKPAEGVHAIQMELAQRAYMTEAPPWEYDPAKAERLRAVLADLLGAIEKLALSGGLSR